MAYKTPEGEEKTPTIEQLIDRIERLDRYIDSRIDSVRRDIETIRTDIRGFKEKFEMLVTLLAGKKIVTQETAEHFVEKHDLKPESVIKWFLNQGADSPPPPDPNIVEKEHAHEINYGVCEYCGRFNLGTPTHCDYCKKALVKEPVVGPAEGL